MKQSEKNPTKGDLRVWWIPQVPMKPFRVAVDTPAEAKKLMATLAEYDIFQYENKIKPDYCNAGGLECFSQDDDGEWCEWHDEATGDGIDEFTPEQVA